MIKIYTQKEYNKNVKDGEWYRVLEIEGVPTLEELKEIAPLAYFTEGNFMYLKEYSKYGDGDSDVVDITKPLSIESVYDLNSMCNHIDFERITSLMIGSGYPKERIHTFLEYASECIARFQECMKNLKQKEEEWGDEYITFCITEDGSVEEI